MSDHHDDYVRQVRERARQLRLQTQLETRDVMRVHASAPLSTACSGAESAQEGKTKGQEPPISVLEFTLKPGIDTHDESESPRNSGRSHCFITYTSALSPAAAPSSGVRGWTTIRPGHKLDALLGISATGGIDARFLELQREKYPR